MLSSDVSPSTGGISPEAAVGSVGLVGVMLPVEIKAGAPSISMVVVVKVAMVSSIASAMDRAGLSVGCVGGGLEVGRPCCVLSCWFITGSIIGEGQAGGGGSIDCCSPAVVVIALEALGLPFSREICRRLLLGARSY